MTCHCGHVEDEHGDDSGKYPASTACLIEGCDCFAFEEADEDGDVESDFEDDED